VKYLVLGCLVAALGSSPTLALSGNAQGCVFLNDTREETSSAAGSQHTNHAGGDPDPLTQARVKILGGGGGSVGESETDSNGCFNIAWSDWLAFGFPTSGYKLRVEYANNGDFYVASSGGAQWVTDFNITIHNNNEFIGSFNVGSPEAALVFMTTIQVWDRIVETSANLRARMTNVRVDAGVASGAECPTGFSCTIDKNHVAILNGHGEDRPMTSVAHELGHSIVLHSWNISSFAVPAGCSFTHSFTGVHACESIPWNEGFANFWAVVFGWTKNATAPTFGTVGGAVIESPHSVCASSGTPWRIEACHTAALWDFFDDPSGDDDAIDDSATNVAAFTFVDTLNHYCSGTSNRCDQETGSHGRNHWDFLFNFSSRYAGDLVPEARDIYEAANIDSGGEEPF
jgi:hypothetical protein